MKKKKKTKSERRKSKNQKIKNSWQVPNAEREDRHKREKILEDKKTSHNVAKHIQALEFEPEIAFNEEVSALKKIQTKKELGKKHRAFLAKVKEFKGNGPAELHYSTLAKEVRKLINL